MSEINAIQVAVSRIEPTSPIDEVAQAMGMLENLMRRGRELKAELEAKVIEHIEANGPLTIGPMLTKVVAYEPETKCQDVPGAVEAIMATERGFAALGECLSVNAVKHGAAKRVLSAEDYERLFVTTRKPVLKDGKASKKLLTTNTDFINA